MKDGRFYDSSVKFKDPLTGMSLYTYNQKEKTVTESLGDGVADKVGSRPRN